jgi:hypothetical protein
MESGTAAALFALAIFIIIGAIMISIFIVVDDAEEESNKCLQYDCPYLANYVGSVETKSYYSCSCNSIPEIKGNVSCFLTPNEAKEKGFIRKC